MPSADRPHGIYTRAYWLRVAVVGLTAAVLLTALFTILGRTTAVPVMLKHSLVHSSIMAGLCGALLPGIRRRIARASAWVQWAVTIPSLLGLAAVGTALACGLIVLTSAHELFWPSFTFALPINALITMTLGVGMSLYEAQRVRLDAVTLELRTRELEAERDRKLALQARLASLESRLQPHFLFNTLNAITSLIQDDPDQAERMVERLAALLRFSLDASERGLVPLADELKIVADYLEIERARLGERLSFTLDVEADAAGREVPPLAVQTLVENSVKHAIAPRPAGGRIRVTASVTNDRLLLSVWDDGPGFTAAAIRPGHGLDSLQARLGARFGPAAALTIAPRDGGTLVTVAVRGRNPDAVSAAALLRAFVVDDEPLALKRLSRMLTATGRVEIVGQATDPEKALQQIVTQPVDVLFLDIHMPGLNGFQVVERVPAGPLVVFTTAHDQHAVRAFEVNAIDYLLKPVERERLDRALDRVAQRRAEPAGTDLRGALERLARDLRAASYLDHVASRVRDRVQLIPVGEVTHLLARDRATYAVTAGAELMLDMTLAELERRLDPARFFRIHRAILVNLAWVGELQADDLGHLTAGLKDARRTELPVSRDRVRALKERLGLV